MQICSLASANFYSERGSGRTERRGRRAEEKEKKGTQHGWMGCCVTQIRDGMGWDIPLGTCLQDRVAL